jgi:shikimate kinase
LSRARPLLTGVNPRATYKSLLDARLPVYREVSTVEVDTDKRSPEEVVAEIARLMDITDGVVKLRGGTRGDP